MQLEIDQTLHETSNPMFSIFLPDKDINKSIQAEGPFSVSGGQIHPSTHNTALFQGQTVYFFQRGGTWVCDPLIYHM